MVGSNVTSGSLEIGTNARTIPYSDLDQWYIRFNFMYEAA